MCKIKMILLIAMIFSGNVSKGQYDIRSEYSELKFTEVWVWEYTDTTGTINEMAVYHEPELNYWLLTPEAFGQSDEMTEWFILKSDGNVLHAYRDAETDGQERLTDYRLLLNKNIELPDNWIMTGQTKYFGDKRLSIQVFKGKEYSAGYERTIDRSIFYISETKADLQILYAFNSLNIEAKLPVVFPVNIPGNYIVLDEFTTLMNGEVKYTFKYISHAEYYINLRLYEK